MAIDTGCVKKQEETIRGLVMQCKKIQAETQAILEQSFRRQPASEDKCEGISKRPNVLDEIIDDLTELREAQKTTIDFIQREIVPKL